MNFSEKAKQGTEIMQVITNVVSSLKSGHTPVGMEDLLQKNSKNTKNTAVTTLKTTGPLLETSLPRVDETSHHVVQKAQHTSGWVPYFLVREIDKVRCEKQPQEIIPLRKYTIQPNSNVESSSQGRSEDIRFHSLPSLPSRDLLQYRALCPHKREIDSLSKRAPF